MGITTIGSGTSAAGPMDLLYSETVGASGAASIDTGTIDCTPYFTLELRLCARTDRVSPHKISPIALYLNGDQTAANYHNVGAMHGKNASDNDEEDEVSSDTAKLWEVSGDTTEDIFDMCTGTVGMVNTSALRTVSLGWSSVLNGSASNTIRRIYYYAMVWDTAAAITQLTVAPMNGENFVENTSFQVYGVK